MARLNVMRIPDPCLVVLLGASGSGKTTFARQHFLPTQIVSSDVCRGLVSDDENDQAATSSAFEVLHTIVAERLRLGRLTVVDATNVQRHARDPLVALADRFDVAPVAIVLDVPLEVCLNRNSERPDRTLDVDTLRMQQASLDASLLSLEQEGFVRTIRIRASETVASARIRLDRQ